MSKIKRLSRKRIWKAKIKNFNPSKAVFILIAITWLINLYQVFHLDWVSPFGVETAHIMAIFLPFMCPFTIWFT